MKKKILKSLSVMLAVVLTLTAAPLSGFVGLELPDWLDFSIMSNAEDVATSGNCGENVTWTFDESTGTLTVSGAGEMNNYSSNNRPWENHEDSIRKVVINNGVRTIGVHAFYNCDSLTNVTIGNSVTTIGAYAFDWCRSLTNITISDSITIIGNSAFSNCDKLTSITIPDSVTTIDNYAFRDCTSLTSVTIADGLITIGYGAFSNCARLTSIMVDSNNEYYSNDKYGVLFNKDKTTLVQYPAGNTQTNYTIPDSVTSIGVHAFENCDSLTNITIPDSITIIGNFAFEHCSKLTNITLPDSVTTIGDRSFYNCGSLTSVTIPDSVTTIGSSAFYNCGSLTSVTIPDSVTTIGDSAFGACRSLTRITVDSNNEYYSNDEYGVLFNKDKTTLVQYPIGNTQTSYTIPNSVTNIGSHAFALCNNLTNVTILNSVTTIGYGAFGACHSLTSITIGNSVTTIDIFAFDGCDSLTNVTIPDSVTIIGAYAFRYCDSLTDVYYTGTEEQWNEISIGSYNEPLLNATIHYNHVVKSLAVLSTNKSFTVKTGDKMGLSFGIMSNGLLEEDWKKMSIVVSDPTIVSLSNYKETDYGYAIDVTGLKEGSTNLTITDTETGLSTSIVVNVFDEYTETYSYSIENIATFHPNNSWECHLNTCIYDMNGLYVDNYNVSKSGDKYIVTFDAYNQRYHHGAVDIYDADGNWMGSDQIEKNSDISSLYDTGEQIYYMIFGGSWVTYQHAMQSKKTPIEIEVPDGGYFTISNNFAASHGTFFYNFSEILFDASMTWLEATVDYAVGDIDIDAGDLAKLLIDNVLENPNARDAWVEIFKTTIKDLLVNFEKDVLSGSIDKAYSNLSTEVESVLYSALKIDWKNLLKTASGIGESAFEKFAGPAGIVLKGCFFATEQLNRFYQADDIVYSIHEAYATVYSSIDEGFINPYGVTVNTNGNMDTEAVLQVFRISKDDSVDVILNSNNPLEQHELYNICFVKNDKLVQPNGKVKVYVPIPEGMDSNTCVIYRQEADDSWTILDAHIEGNYLVFETDHFSLYALVGNKAELTIKSLPDKLTYTRNDVIDTTGLVLELNGETITESYYCNPSVMFEYGIQTITVKYGKTSVEFDVFVQEPVYDYTFSIRSPSRTEIRNKDGIVLHSNVEGAAPEDSYVKWEASNGNFDKSADGSNLKIIAKNKGWTTFTAILCDADGNELARDTVDMYSKSGFFDKIGGFFRSLFGSTKIYEN